MSEPKCIDPFVEPLGTKSCPNHHFRNWGYCPYCGEYLHAKGAAGQPESASSAGAKP